MDIIDNALIRKYFGREDKESPNTPAGIAYDVLMAMQEPIRKGERILLIDSPRLEAVSESIMNYAINGFHPWYVRLPSRFQAAVCQCGCHDCGLPRKKGYSCCDRATQPPPCNNYVPEYGVNRFCVNCHKAESDHTPEPMKFECPLHGLDRDESLCTCEREPECSGINSDGKLCPKHKPASQEKCYCRKFNVKGTYKYHSPEDCSSEPIVSKPGDAAEEQIKKLTQYFLGDYISSCHYQLAEILRELARMVREGK